MSIFNWFRREPKYAIWIDLTDEDLYLARIVDAKSAALCHKAQAGSPHTIFMMSINKRRSLTQTAWEDAIAALDSVCLLYTSPSPRD